MSTAYAPQAGTFTFKPGYPSQLTSQWKVGQDNMLDQGAIRAFESTEGLTMDGVAGPQVWADLLTAAGKNQVNQNGYSYALASQDSPHESLKVWHNGKLILSTAANTGIPGASTVDGTFPVYERLQFQIMKGTNPDVLLGAVAVSRRLSASSKAFVSDWTRPPTALASLSTTLWKVPKPPLWS